MNICGSSQHDEIVFIGKDCPLCEALNKIEDLESELDYANKELAKIAD